MDGGTLELTRDAVTSKMISQTAPGKAKLTLARYFDSETEAKLYINKPLIYYKKYVVGKIIFANQIN